MVFSGMRQFLLIFSVLFFIVNNAHAADGENSAKRKSTTSDMNLSITDPDYLPYQRPSNFDWLTAGPTNLLSFAKRIRPVENRWWLAGIGLSTAILIKYDQQILDESQRFASRIGLISENRNGRETYTIIDWSVGEYDLPLIFPKNLNSVMYFIGDGLTHLGIIGGLVGYGLSNDDNRSLSTASQTLEALLVTGIVVQAIKRTTGREAGFKATKDGGKWQWFPNQMEYNKDVPKYDAFPSGHIATVMATTTVLAENYPEYTYIRPVGYSMMGLLAFAMMNNGVHWAGDYPLGLGIGYVAGMVAVERNKKQRTIAPGEVKSSKALSFNALLPYAKDSHYGVSYIANF